MNCFLKKARRILKKRKAVLGGCTAILLLFCSCGAQSGRIQRTDTAMGTVIRQTLYVTEKESTAPDDIMECLRLLEEQTLSWRAAGSGVYRINEASLEAFREREAAGSGGMNAEGAVTAEASEKLGQLLEKCLEVSKRSEGAFDVTIGSAARLWRIDELAAGRETEEAFPPGQEEIADALALCGYEKVSLAENPSGQYEVTLPAGMQLDLGAVGKGEALTELSLLLAEHEEVSGAVISVGGSILTYGRKPDNGSFQVAVVNPLDDTKRIGYLALRGQWCISTSGDYERYVEADGRRYHHILDPHTGMPADSGLSGVTILSRDGFLSDALSTACFVLGEEKGLALAEELGAEALFVDKQGKISMTDGMEQYFHLY